MAKIILKKTNQTSKGDNAAGNKVIKKKPAVTAVKIKMAKAKLANSPIHATVVNLKKGGKVKLEAVKKPKITVAKSSSSSKTESEGNWNCTTTSNSIDSTVAEAFILNPQFENIYAGAIYDFASIANGSYKTVPYDRSPLVISTDATISSGNKITVDNPESTNVTDAVAKIIGKVKKYGSMTHGFFGRIRSEEDWFFKTAGSGYYLGFGGSHNFDFKSKEKSNKYFVQHIQPYLKVFVSDDYDSPSSFFDFDGKNPVGTIDPDWVYVNSVTYGRVLNVMYESDYSFESMGIDVNMYANFAVAAIDLKLSDQQEKVLANTRVTVMSIGGDAVYAGLLSNPSSLKDMQKRVDDYLKNLGAPVKIGYSLKTLDNSLVGTRLITDYTSRSCAVRALKYRVTWVLVQNAVSDDSGSAAEMKVFARIAAFNSNGQMIVDVDKKNKELDAWNKMSATVQKLKPKPWTFTVGTSENPLELVDGDKWQVNKKVEFNIPIEDSKAKIAIRTDVREFDDFDDDFFEEAYWEIKVADLVRTEKVELICRQGVSRVRFIFSVEPIF